MKNGLSLAIAVLLVITLTSCETDELLILNTESQYNKVIIADIAGREVSLPSSINKVVVFGRGAARLVIYSGGVEKLAGVSDMDKSKEINMPYTVIYAERFASLPSVGVGGAKDSAYEEEILSIQPDVIISTHDDVTSESLQNKLGIPVVCVSNQGGVFDESLYDSLRILGKMFGTQVHVDQLIQKMEGWKADLVDRVQKSTMNKDAKVYVGGVNYLGARGFDGSYAKYPPFEVLGINNIANITGTSGAVTFDKETIASIDPDFIFLNPLNMDIINEDYRSAMSYYDSLKAVKNSQVYSQPPFNYNGTNVEIAISDAYYAGKTLFPDIFDDVNMKDITNQISRAFLNGEIYDLLTNENLGYFKISLGKRQ